MEEKEELVAISAKLSTSQKRRLDRLGDKGLNVSAWIRAVVQKELPSIEKRLADAI